MFGGDLLGRGCLVFRWYRQETYLQATLCAILNTVLLINTDSKSGQEQTQVVSGGFCQVNSNAPGLVAILSILQRASRLQMKCSRHCSGFIKGSLVFWSRRANCNIISSFSIQPPSAENWVSVVVEVGGR